MGEYIFSRVGRVVGANKLFSASIVLDLLGTLALAYSLQVVPASILYHVHNEMGGKEVLYPMISAIRFYTGLILLAAGTLLNAFDRLRLAE